MTSTTTGSGTPSAPFITVYTSAEGDKTVASYTEDGTDAGDVHRAAVDKRKELCPETNP